MGRVWRRLHKREVGEVKEKTRVECGVGQLSAILCKLSRVLLPAKCSATTAPRPLARLTVSPSSSSTSKSPIAPRAGAALPLRPVSSVYAFPSASYPIPGLHRRRRVRAAHPHDSPLPPEKDFRLSFSSGEEGEGGRAKQDAWAHHAGGGGGRCPFLAPSVALRDPNHQARQELCEVPAIQILHRQGCVPGCH